MSFFILSAVGEDGFSHTAGIFDKADIDDIFLEYVGDHKLLEEKKSDDGWSKLIEMDDGQKMYFSLKKYPLNEPV